MTSPSTETDARATAIPAPDDSPTAIGRYLPWLLGVAILSAVVLATLHASDAAAFAALAERAIPGWLAAAFVLQTVTYLAQAQVWRVVASTAGYTLRLRAAYRLSMVKLLADQTRPSSGLSGSVAVAAALQHLGIPRRVTTAGVVVSATSYMISYGIALVPGLVLLWMRGHAGALVLAPAALLLAMAAVVVAFALRAVGSQPPAHTPSSRWRRRLGRPLELLRAADPALARSPRLLAAGAALQLAILALDCLTLWALIRALGANASLSAVFASFMLSTLLRTVSIVPGGLGAFEAVSVLSLRAAGLDLPVALSATLLFRGLSFWLPMLPGALLARGLLGRQTRTPTAMLPVGPYWSHSAAEALDRLGTGRAGLCADEAARRLELHGPNEVEEAPRTASLRLLTRQFQSPLVLILVAGAVVSLLLRDWLDAAIILAIVTGSALLGFGQEYRAGTAVSALRRRLALQLTALRDGVELTVPVSTIVPGDLVRLSAGSLVPGDGLVLEAEDFLVSEANLTGESFPVEKRPGVLPEDTPLAQRSNCVFLGTSVRSGCATVLIVHTGGATSYGAIAARLAARPEETEFARGLRRFGQLLMSTIVLVMLLVIAANQLLGRPALESLLFAMALSVGMTPELLPAIVSVTLSRGARKMATSGVVVRRLEAIENLGSIDVLCTDKTGTLTEGAITLHGAADTKGLPSDEVQRLAFLNAAFETGIANPIDAAIIAAAQARHLQVDGVRKIDEIPYDFMRKRLTVVVQEPSAADHLVITKGAFSNVLDVCAIEPEDRERCERYYRQMSEEGFRVIAVAMRRGPPKVRYTHDDEQAMTLAGVLLLLDPPKPDVATTLADLARLGIVTKIISGDNRYIVAHVARAIGLDAKAMLTGEQLARTSDEALWSLAPRTDIFVEVDPQQKERIVRALQRTGHAVGYLGDGINDAPALHAADVGISVDSAVDVARESADIVLLERSLAVLRGGVEDGRATFANTLKYVGITTSANFGNMISMAIATPLLPFLPLSAKQILLNNFISDLPSMAISTDRVDAQRLESAQRWHMADVRRYMIVFGLVSTVFDLLTFALLLWIFRVPQALFQTTWFVVSLLTELAVVLVLRTQGPAWRSAPSRLLAWTTALAAAAAVVLPYAPVPGRMFGFVPLPLELLAAALAIVALYVMATEAAKRLLFK